MWAGGKSQCNKITGRDAVIFPPFIKTNEKITIFNTDICRYLIFTHSKYFNKNLKGKDEKYIVFEKGNKFVFVFFFENKPRKEKKVTLRKTFCMNGFSVHQKCIKKLHYH